MQEPIKIIVLGASNNPERASYYAVEMFRNLNFNVIPVAKKRGSIFGLEIKNDLEGIDNVHTLAMYLSEQNQEEYIEKIMEIKPKRIIFNPGAENIKLKTLAEKAGIETVEECLFNMMNSGTF